jgi:hypothetical protein
LIREGYLRFLRKMPPILVLFAFLLSMLGQPPVAYAQSETDLSLTAKLGFDGFCKDNYWLPVHVEVENTGPELNTTVQVSYKNGNGGNTATSLDLLLPANSRKEFFLYIYPQGSLRSMHINLLARGHLLKKVDLPITCLSRDNMIFGVLAGDPSTFDVLNEVKPLTGFVRVAQLTIADLPAHPQAWGSLDALIISDIDTGRLTPEQKQALQSWLAAGGKLLIFGGLQWQSTTAGLKDWLPIDVNRTATVNDLPALQAYLKDSSLPTEGTVLAVGELADGAEVLVEQNGMPLLAQKQMGVGAVYYFAADPSLQPLSKWSGMQDLYDHLLGFKTLTPVWSNDQSYGYYDVNQALATIPELGLPSVFYICGLLALYVLIIGPLHYFVLRRIKRRELAWVTIPSLVVIFTGLAYSSGMFYRGTTPILNRLAVLQAWDGIDQARARALVGIYSPVRARYDLETTDNFMIAPLAGGDTNLQANGDWSTLLDGQSMVMPDVQIEIGGMKPVAVEGNLPALAIEHDLMIVMDKSNPVLSGTITNKSQHTIRDAFLVTPGQWTKLGDIPPGASEPIDLSLLGASTGPVFYGLSAMDILSVDYTDLQTDADTVRRNAFLQTMLYSQYPLNRGNWGIYLMGWVDEAMLPVGLQNKRFKTIDTTLYIDMLSPSIQAGSGELIVPPSLLRWESSNVNASAYYASGIPAGGYTLRFQPAFPIRFGNVKSLRLFLRSNALPGEILASAWNFEEKEWTSIPLTSANVYTDIPEPNHYLGPDNEIRIKVISNRSDYTEISASYVTLVVEP